MAGSTSLVTQCLFQSTLPVGEATLVMMYFPSNLPFQSTLPAREATSRPEMSTVAPTLFQSTLPAREATKVSGTLDQLPAISIHASRGGSDPLLHQLHSLCNYFNPRFPWGKRRVGVLQVKKADIISIHASREGSDSTIPSSPRSALIFQSTLPAREATVR